MTGAVTSDQKAQPRYCIGCKHLCYTDKEISCGSSWTGSWTSADAAMACGKGHWQVFLTGGAVGFDFEQAMEKAQTCGDYAERPHE